MRDAPKQSREEDNKNQEPKYGQQKKKLAEVINLKQSRFGFLVFNVEKKG